MQAADLFWPKAYFGHLILIIQTYEYASECNCKKIHMQFNIISNLICCLQGHGENATPRELYPLSSAKSSNPRCQLLHDLVPVEKVTMSCVSHQRLHQLTAHFCNERPILSQLIQNEGSHTKPNMVLH